MSATGAIYNPESASSLFVNSPNGVSVEQNLNWFCIHTKAKQEDRAAKNIIAWGMEAFAPQLPRQVHNFARPLFPRYIFARVNLETAYRKLAFTRGLNSIDYIVSGLNGEPCAVEAQIIEEIRARMDQQGIIRNLHDVKCGDQVRIADGMFKDFCGVFEKESGDERAIILLHTILKTRVTVAINELRPSKFDVVRA